MRTLLTALLVVLLAGSVVSAEEDAGKKAPVELKAQTVCPVMGGKINKNSFFDHEGQRIYVCCAGCIPALTKSPEKYIVKMAAKGEKPAKLQTVCPVMGGKIRKSSYFDHEGQRIYVCCAGCIPALKKNPAKYIEKMKADGITLDSVPNPKKEK